MNSLIRQIREAKTLADVEGPLNQLRATSTQRKLVEASILQRMNPNPASYEYGISMLNAVIRELDPEEEPAEPESPGLKRKGEHFVKEELLDNHNSEEHNKGSEQSTENTEPYKGEGKNQGDEDILNAPDTENQMSETHGEEDHEREREAGGGAEPPYPDVLAREMGPMHPDIAKKMAGSMGKIPPMGTADQMKQQQYTVRHYHETVVKPLLAHSKKQDAAIRKLSQQIRETQARAGTYTLDLDTVKQNAIAKPYRETVGSTSIPANVSSPEEVIAYTQQRNKNFDLNTARSEITQANNEMSN